MDGGRVIFVVPADPTPDPALPHGQWSLDEHALEDCMLLAHALRRFEQPCIISAPERFVHQSASVIALRFGGQFHDDPRLACAPGSDRTTLAASAGPAVREARAKSPTNTAIVVAQREVILACFASEGIVDLDALAEELTLPSAWSLSPGRGHVDREFATTIR